MAKDCQLFVQEGFITFLGEVFLQRNTKCGIDVEIMRLPDDTDRWCVGVQNGGQHVVTKEYFYDAWQWDGAAAAPLATPPRSME